MFSILLSITSERKTVIYARVSNRNQRDDLSNQVEFLKQFANANGVIVDETIEDIGSGLNYKRKKWNHLLNFYCCIQETRHLSDIVMFFHIFIISYRGHISTLSFTNIHFYIYSKLLLFTATLIIH
jgi:hypothetical protein